MQAFATPTIIPTVRRNAVATVLTSRRQPTQMLLEPSTLHHAANLHIPEIQNHLHSLSILLSDVTETAIETAKKPGVWGSFVNLIESAIVSLRDSLAGAGVEGAYGLAIVLFTFGVKAITFPINYKQMESTIRMQAISPQIRKLQADYKDNPSVLNQQMAELYREQNINPLAGCLPVFAQLPIWIALYRSVLNLASDNLLNESFLWLPSLQGPVAKSGQGLDTWLFPLKDGAPPVGWHDALCYLILPIILVATQSYSQKLISPTVEDPNQQGVQRVLKFMPLLIGWFSLNVPSGLGVYWVTNNILSTAQTLFIRSRFPDLINQASQPVPEEATQDAQVLPSSRIESVDGFSSNGTAGKTTKPKSKKRRKRR